MLKACIYKRKLCEVEFLEAFSVSDDYKTEPIDFYFEFKKSSTCSLAELVKRNIDIYAMMGILKSIQLMI